MNSFLTLEKLFQKTLFDLKKVLKIVVGLGYAFESVYFAVFRPFRLGTYFAKCGTYFAAQ